MHGFTLKSPLGPVSHWQAIDDPNGVGTTTVNGVNNTGKLVGFYTDAAATPTACSPPRNTIRSTRPSTS